MLRYYAMPCYAFLIFAISLPLSLFFRCLIIFFADADAYHPTPPLSRRRRFLQPFFFDFAITPFHFMLRRLFCCRLPLRHPPPRHFHFCHDIYYFDDILRYCFMPG